MASISTADGGGGGGVKNRPTPSWSLQGLDHFQSRPALRSRHWPWAVCPSLGPSVSSFLRVFSDNEGLDVTILLWKM